MVVPPCAAAGYVYSDTESRQPCVEIECSRSRRRRMRERGVVIRRAQRQAVGILEQLHGRDQEVHGRTKVLRAEAEEFFPSEVCADWNTMNSNDPLQDLQVEVLLDYLTPGANQDSDDSGNHMHRHPELLQGSSSCSRKVMREMQSQSELPETSLTNELRSIIVVPTRQCLREALTAEVLADPAVTPNAKNVRVCPDVHECRGIDDCVARGCSITLDEPRRLFRHPVANKTLLGSNVRGIGEGDMSLRDNPMFVEGFVEVVATSDSRIKVVGEARAEPAGKKYHIVGWIEKDGVT